jgi:flagellar basal-body rod protein FlgB
MLEELTRDYARYMDLLSTRQRLAASNIANADTPGYHTQDIDFQFEYATLTPNERPQLIEPFGMKAKPDGNTVDIDREARLLAENAMRFNEASTLLRSELKLVRRAIEGGSGS